MVNNEICDHPWLEILLVNRKMPRRCLKCNEVMQNSEEW